MEITYCIIFKTNCVVQYQCIRKRFPINKLTNLLSLSVDYAEQTAKKKGKAILVTGRGGL
jgi:hypothetical protein